MGLLQNMETDILVAIESIEMLKIKRSLFNSILSNMLLCTLQSYTDPILLKNLKKPRVKRHVREEQPCYG